MTFEQYLAERGSWLPGFARVLCGHRELAEDVLQEVLLRAHRHRARVAAADDPDAPLTPALDLRWLQFTPARALDDPSTWPDARTAFP